ncbi:MAG: hypothetical protein ACM31C_15705, partial [Acidobacteriota bacterium]
TVNGRPVYGSCVALQAAARHLAREQAVKECIDFELLAQAAEQHGIASDPEVAYETRTALVSRLVATAFEDGITQPAQLGDFWDRATTTKSKHSLIWSVDHDEYRGSTYVRVPVPEHATAEQEAQAKVVADRIADAAASEVGLLPAQFVELAMHAAGGAKLERADNPPYRVGGLEDHYGAALFAIAEIGRTTPHPVRTKWGWDVILYTSLVPASHPPPDELVRLLMPQVKQAFFPVWVGRIERSLGIHVEIDKDAAARLEKLP